MNKAVVLGGGIGGVEAAISLRKKQFDVELVSERDYLFVYPLAIWIPTGERSFDRTSISLADIARAHGFRLTLDEVTGISGADRSFTLKQRRKAAGLRLSGHRARRAQDAAQGQGARPLDLRGAAGEPASEGASGRPDRQGQRHDRRRLRRQSQGLERSAGRPGLRVPLQRAPPAAEAEDPQALLDLLLRADAESGHPHGREGRRHDGPHVRLLRHPLVHGQEDQASSSRAGSSSRTTAGSTPT